MMDIGPIALWVVQPLWTVIEVATLGVILTFAVFPFYCEISPKTEKPEYSNIYQLFWTPIG